MRPSPEVSTQLNMGLLVMAKAKTKIRKVLHEFKEHELRSGSKHGPKVTNRRQAIAIAMSESRRAGHKKRK